MSWHPDGGGGGRPPVPPSHTHKGAPHDRHSATYTIPPEGASAELPSSHGNYMNFQSLQNLNSSQPEGYSGYNHGSNVTEPHSGAGLPPSVSWHAGVSSALSNQSMSSSASSVAMAPGSEPRLRKGMAYNVTALEYSPGERRREKLEQNKENFPGNSPVHASKSAYDLRQSDAQDSNGFRPQQQSKLSLNSSWNRPGPYKAANYENVETYDYTTSASGSSSSKPHESQTQQRQSASTMTTSYYMAERDRLLGHSTRHHRSLDGGRDDTLQLSSPGETDLDAPQSPPPLPPVRDGSSLRFIRGGGAGNGVGAFSGSVHERFSSWPSASNNEEGQKSSFSTSLRTSWSPSAPSPQDYMNKSRTMYQPSLSAQPEENHSLKALKDTLDYPPTGALNIGDSERYTKNLALEMKSEYASQNKNYPCSSSTDGYSSTVDSNKDNYVEMAPAPLENDYIVKEPKLEKRFTDIPFIAKELVRRESLKDSESSTPPPLPTSPPPLPSTGPPPPSSQSSQPNAVQQSFNVASHNVASTGSATSQSQQQRSPLHGTYSTYLVRQTKPYYNTSTQTEEVTSGSQQLQKGTSLNKSSQGVATEEPPPQVECRSVQVSSSTLRKIGIRHRL